MRDTWAKVAVIAFLTGAAVANSASAAQTTDEPRLFPDGRTIGAASYGALFAAGSDVFGEAVALNPASWYVQTPKATEPEHTGFSALFRESGGDFVAFPKRTSTWVILGVGGAMALAVHPIDDDLNEELQENNGVKNFFKPGKYLGYGWVQTGVAVGTYLIGRYAMKSDNGRTNRVSHLGFDLLRANILVQALTYGIKYSVQRERPNGECCSFPSGHASVTFATASVLERHFGYRAAWPTFVIAGYVAASRLADNVHFLSDVLFGSALGMASGWTVVGTHGRKNFALYPVPSRGGVAIAGMWVPAGSHGP